MMRKIFHNILVPVYLDKQADEVINTAVEFSNQLSCHLHLFFVTGPAFLNWYNQKEITIKNKNRIFLLKQKYLFRLKAGLKIFTAYQSKVNYAELAKYAETHDIDMVLTPEQIKHQDFYNKCMPVFNCPIISLKTYSVSHPPRTIVLPVGTSFPINTIRIAAYLAKQFGLSLHLISLSNDPPLKQMGYMKRAFELLKTNTDLPVVCHSVTGKKLDQLALEYASVHEGMVVMNAENETTAPGIISRIISKLTYKKTKIPIITVG
jgi:hypothetical protein